MAWVKRIVLFLAINILVSLTISFLLNILGVRPYLTQAGLNYGSLIGFCLVYGMVGAFISLALSRIMAKWMMGVEVIDEQTTDAQAQAILQTVHRLARSAGLTQMPEVGIYDSLEVNAFATGPTKSRSLVAVSTGLLQRMDKQSVEGVLGHEIAHIANGDMVTMTLIQGVVNAFVMFLSRVIAFAISQALRERNNNKGEGLSRLTYSLVVFVLEMVFMLLGSLLVAWFSRQREFRADRGGAEFAGRSNMIKALRSLSGTLNIDDPHEKTQASSLASLKISSRPSKFFALFSTHPPLEERIYRLEQGL